MVSDRAGRSDEKNNAKTICKNVSSCNVLTRLHTPCGPRRVAG